MKTKVVKSEIVNRWVSAAVMQALKTLHNVNYGIRVTHISCEGTDLQPSGVGYTIRIDVQISGELEPVVLPEEKETPAT